MPSKQTLCEFVFWATIFVAEITLTVFVTDTVAHPQYISGNEQKNELGSLDFLYNYLIFQVFAAKNFFDFGPSHEENGRKINEGILFWKETFGAKTTIQNFYEVQTSDYHLLENVMLW